MSTPKARAARVLGVEDSASGGLELWTLAAFGIFCVAGAGIVFLGARPGGRAPIWFWLHGRFLLVALSFLWSLVGLGWAWSHPPFLQRRRGRAFIALVLVVGVLPLPMPYPTSHEHRPSHLGFLLPLRGTWVVHQSGTSGGPLAALTADRRFGLTLVDPRDLERETPPETAQGWAGYGRTVEAPADGTVVWVRDGLPDRSPAAAGGGDDPELGNLIVIEVAEEQYLFLAHLARGSLRVAPGDEVSAGEPLAQVGFSGRMRFTPYAHLSLHLQDSPEEGWGEAIPWTFRHYESGESPMERGIPQAGERVRRGD